MAFMERSVLTCDGKRVMSLEELKRWLRRFDSNGDGRVSDSELREAVRLSGGLFASWKSKRDIDSADDNHSSYIDVFGYFYKAFVHFDEVSKSAKGDRPPQLRKIRIPKRKGV